MSQAFFTAKRFAATLASAAAIAVTAFAAAPVARAADPVLTGRVVSTGMAPVRLFGTTERVNSNIFMFNKWVMVMARYEQEKALEAQPCTGGNCAVQQWNQFLAGIQGQDRVAQLQAVNAYVNRTRYQADDSRYGMVDYWATPREFLGRSGDCEDYAFTKYLSLKKLGWSVDQLRIVVMMHHGRRELHAVLVAYHGGTAYVLDNLLPSATDHRSLPQYQPIYSINEKAWFHHQGWSPIGRGYSALPNADETAEAAAEPAAAPARRPAPAAMPTTLPTPMPAALSAPVTVRAAKRSFAARADESTASIFAR